ncbi:hypothetical protein KIPB_015539, partial [Kipferlia bialata]|eukprot:g15539.t1
MSDPAIDRNRETDTPPATSTQAQGDTQRQTEDKSDTGGCTTALRAEAVTRAADTGETHKNDRVAMSTDHTSETESHESTDEGTENSAAGSDVPMDGESEESAWEGSESSSSEEESGKAGTGAVSNCVSASKDPEPSMPDSLTTETMISPPKPVSEDRGVARCVSRPDHSNGTPIPVHLEHKWQSRLAE